MTTFYETMTQAVKNEWEEHPGWHQGTIVHEEYGAFKVGKLVAVWWNGNPECEDVATYYIACIEEDVYPEDVMVWLWDAESGSLCYALETEVVILEI